MFKNIFSFKAQLYSEYGLIGYHDVTFLSGFGPWQPGHKAYNLVFDIEDGELCEIDVNGCQFCSCFVHPTADSVAPNAPLNQPTN
jgi:hypothetical protein